MIQAAKIMKTKVENFIACITSQLCTLGISYDFFVTSESGVNGPRAFVLRIIMSQ